MNQQNNSFLDKPIFAWSLTCLIIWSTICYTLETLPGLHPTIVSILYYSEIFTVAIFTLEYLTRIYLAQHKIKFIFSFFGIIDLLAILPFYLATSIDLRAGRLLRLFRLVRVLKIGQYHPAIYRLSQAFSQIKGELLVFTIASILLLYLSAVGMYQFEHHAQPEVFQSILDSLWWAVATLTTVGYGDIYPITTGGRIFTFITLMLGLGLVAVPTGIIASALTDNDADTQTNNSTPSRVDEVLDIVKRTKLLGDYDSNIIRMAAEIIAENDFGMTKTTKNNKDTDYKIGNETVQIKTFSCHSIATSKAKIFFKIQKNSTNKLIVILIYRGLKEYEILYNGELTKAGKTQNSTSMITISLDDLKSDKEINAIVNKCQISDSVSN